MSEFKFDLGENIAVIEQFYLWVKAMEHNTPSKSVLKRQATMVSGAVEQVATNMKQLRDALKKQTEESNEQLPVSDGE